MIEANKRSNQTSVQRPFHISQAVLDMANNGLSDSQVWLQCNGKAALIANLSSDKVTQVRLDLAFGKGDIVSFVNKCIVGDSDVHLSGYYLLDDEEQEEESPIDAFSANSSGNCTLTNCHFILKI